MWEILPWVAWIVAVLLIGVLVRDFFLVNRGSSEDVLLSSREGVDELFAANAEAKG